VAAARSLLLGPFAMLTPRLGVRIDGALLALGLGVLVWRARREPAARVLLLWLAAALAAVCLWTPLRFERYYLPAVAPIVAAECVALAWLAGGAGRGLRALVARAGRGAAA
jgi:hypothetical protein